MKKSVERAGTNILVACLCKKHNGWENDSRLAIDIMAKTDIEEATLYLYHMFLQGKIIETDDVHATMEYCEQALIKMATSEEWNSYQKELTLFLSH